MDAFQEPVSLGSEWQSVMSDMVTTVGKQINFRGVLLVPGSDALTTGLVCLSLHISPPFSGGEIPIYPRI